MTQTMNEILDTLSELRIHQKAFFILTMKAKTNPKLYAQRRQELELCKALEAKIDDQLSAVYPDFKERMAVLATELVQL